MLGYRAHSQPLYLLSYPGSDEHTALTDMQIYLNNWVMHPVARVSIKYWKTSACNTVFFSDRFYCALITLITIKSSTKNTVLHTEVFQYLIDADLFLCLSQVVRIVAIVL
jgi:hypothetical protein